MCGIAGFIDFKKKSNLEDAIRMSGSLVHRGPDDKGAEFIEHARAGIGMGFRRLSIIDLSELGHQPMHNEDQGTWITFNGEIYNYREIRKKLEKEGHSFLSNSDTEVILKAYQEWGISFIDHLIGMYAIVLADPGNDRVYFIRDRAGVKPLYYYIRDGLILYASELKAFHQHPGFEKEIDPSSLAQFFRQGYVPSPNCIFKNAAKLEPGHWMELDLNTGQTLHKRYWDPQASLMQAPLYIGWDDALIETEKLMKSAFEYRMVADVPVGVFLSGGYDSSCVTALLQANSTSKIKTYTIGFEESHYNEAGYARKVAEHLGTDHHEYFCKTSDARDIIPELPVIFDEPFGDSSAIPTTLVSRIARKYVTVALSADAGDELFAGYPRHVKSLMMIKKLGNVPDRLSHLLSWLLPAGWNKDLASPDRLEKLKNVLKNSDVYSRFRTINETYSPGELSRILEVPYNSQYSAFERGREVPSHTSDLNRILCLEYQTYLTDDILQKVDRATMSASLEGRDPFLDHRLQEWVTRLPDSFKVENGVQKKLLREIVHKYIPKELMERPKMGFGIPVSAWLLNELRDLFEEVLSDSALDRSGLLNVEEVKAIVSKYRQGKLENFERLWFIFVFQLWFKKWM